MEILGDISKEQFLKEYWQKKPLLIKGAFKNWINPISPDELAGLSLEDTIESRIVTEQPAGSSYKLEQGPFKPERYEDLGEANWSLLVQGVDRVHPDVSSLMDRFDFVPNWRRDDVMVSYATDGGSVGPHIDNYDVFLIQGFGKREWKYNDEKQLEDEFIEGLDLRILKNFNPTNSAVLEPGDMLYVPPRVAHHGVAIDESMTYSIGFRAPEHWDLLNNFSKYLAEELDEDVLYEDPGLSLQANPGEVQSHVIDKMQSVMLDYLSDKKQIASWFGRYITEPKMSLNMPPEVIIDEVSTLQQMLSGSMYLVALEGLKISFTEKPIASLFVEGYEIPLELKDMPLAMHLAKTKRFEAHDLESFDDESIDSVVIDLYNRGYFYLSE